MSLQILKEKLNKGCVTASSGLDLQVGDISGGLNIRRADLAGGWIGRLGSIRRFLDDSLNSVPYSMWLYRNTNVDTYTVVIHTHGYLFFMREDEAALVLDENGTCLETATVSALPSSLSLLVNIDDGTSVPDPSHGEQLVSGAAIAYPGALPTIMFGHSVRWGYGATVNNIFFFARGSSPVSMSAQEGTAIIGHAFLRLTGAATYADAVIETTNATDGNEETSAIVRQDSYSTDPSILYLCSPAPAHQFSFVFHDDYDTGNAGDPEFTPTCYRWKNGAWVELDDVECTVVKSGASYSDGYVRFGSGGAHVSAVGLNDPQILYGVHGYWYKFEMPDMTSSGNVGLRASRILAHFYTRPLQSFFDGIWSYPTGFLYYNGTSYVDYLGRVSNESESQYVELDSAGAANTIHVKSEYPITGIAFGIIPGKGNSNAVTIASITQNGDAVASISDGTAVGGATLAQSGIIYFDASDINETKTVLGGDKLPGFWYTITLSGALDAEVELYLCLVAKLPGTQTPYLGVVAYYDYLVAWGDPAYPNRVVFAPSGHPELLYSNSIQYSQPMGDNAPIVRAIVFGKYLVVFKEKGIWLVNESLEVTQMTVEIGLTAPMSVQVIEFGSKLLSTDQVENVFIWFAGDGFYMSNGVGSIKISSPLDDLFQTRITGSWASEGYDLTKISSFIDRENNEYHAILENDTVYSSGLGNELVYNYAHNLWYPRWHRSIGSKINCCLSFLKEGKQIIYVGTSNGDIYCLENGTYDEGNNAEPYVVEQSLETRWVTPTEDGVSLDFDLKDLWAIFGGEYEETAELLFSFYKNFSSSASVSEKELSTYSVDEFVADKLVFNQTKVLAFKFLVEMVKDLTPSDTSIFGWWPGAPGFGTTAIDCSGEGNDGTLAGTVTWGSKCFSFTGATDVIALGVQGLTGSKTILARIYIDEDSFQSKDYYILSDASGAAMGTLFYINGNNGKLYCINYTGTSTEVVNSDEALELKTWISVAFIYNAVTQVGYLYVDGVKVGEEIGMADCASSTAQLAIGNHQASPNSARVFVGNIADISLYTRALSETEVINWSKLSTTRLAHIRELMFSVEQRRIIS